MRGQAPVRMWWVTSVPGIHGGAVVPRVGRAAVPVSLGGSYRSVGVLTTPVLTGRVCDLFVQLLAIVDHCIGWTCRWGTHWWAWAPGTTRGHRGRWVLRQFVAETSTGFRREGQRHDQEDRTRAAGHPTADAPAEREMYRMSVTQRYNRCCR